MFHAYFPIDINSNVPFEIHKKMKEKIFTLCVVL